MRAVLHKILSRRATALLPALMLTSACTLFTSLDGLTGGSGASSKEHDAGSAGSVTGGTDAGSPAAGEPSSDASPGAPDASGASAPSDAGAGDAAAGPSSLTWCQARWPQPSFCSDFDTGPLLADWSSSKVQNGATIALDTSLSLSPSSSFLVTAPAVTGSVVAIGELKESFTTTFAQATYSFDLFADSWPDGTNGDAQVAVITLTGGYAVKLDLWQGGGEIHEDINGTVYTMFDGGVSTGMWTRGTMTLVLPDSNGDGGSVTVSFDGVVMVDHHPVTSSLASGTPEIQLGGAWITDAPMGWTSHFDNVTFNIQ